MSALLKSIYRFNAIPIKIPTSFFLMKQYKLIVKFMWKNKHERMYRVTFQIYEKRKTLMKMNYFM